MRKAGDGCCLKGSVLSEPAGIKSSFGQPFRHNALWRYRDRAPFLPFSPCEVVWSITILRALTEHRP